MKKNWPKMMRDDWDRRAKENAIYYIATTNEPSNRNVESFFREGKEHAIALVQPMFERVGFVPDRKRILEIGCGIGRLFSGFAELGFHEMWGVDVSAEMIKQARELNRDPNTHFLLTNGQDLSGIEDNSMDFCFSYLVFMHVPDPNIVWQYVAEVWRVLRPGGVFQLHFRGYYPFSYRLLRLFPSSLHPAAQLFYQLVTLRWLRGGAIQSVCVPGRPETWSGIAIDPKQVANRLARFGFTNVDVLLESSRLGRFWAVGAKP